MADSRIMRKTDVDNLDSTVIEHSESHIEIRRRYPYLVVFIGHDSGKRFRLKPGKMTMGRSPEADITIEDDRISRIHCIIDWADDIIRIEDNGSTNGTYVDSRKIRGAHVAAGVPVQVGRSVMKIDYKDDAEIKWEESLLRSASIDGLTGISNRQQFMKRAAEEIALARRQMEPVGLVMIDIDHFKRINDTYGHQIGDFVLNRFAGIINQEKRREDIFGRFGGEEFIMMPRGKVFPEGLNEFCERARRIIEGADFNFGDTRIQITASFGFHVEVPRKVDIEAFLTDLIRKADKALYRAKQQGRNRTESLL